MTQVAKMILNELPISPTISEKIEFIKSSKLDFKDFNNFRLLLNSLESFEPSSKLSPKEYKAQINRRIGVFLERLNFLEEKIKSTQMQIPQMEQESKPNEVLSEDENEEDSLSNKAKYFYLLAEIETFANKTEQDSKTLGKLLEKTSELLLNAENLNKDEIDTLEEIKESLQNYFIHLRENEREELKDTHLEQSILQKETQNSKHLDEKGKLQINPIAKNCEIVSWEGKLVRLKAQLKYAEHHTFPKGLVMRIKCVSNRSVTLETLPNPKFDLAILSKTIQKKDCATYFEFVEEKENESSLLTESLQNKSKENLTEKEREALEALSSNDIASRKQEIYETTQNVSDKSQKDLPQNNIRFDENAQMLMVGDDVYRMGLDGVVYKIINYGSEKQFAEKSQKLNPKNLNLEDMYRKYLKGIGINVDEIFKINEKSQDFNPQTIKTSLFDDEEVKPQKKRMG